MPVYVRIHPLGYREYLLVLRNEWEFPTVSMMEGVEDNGYISVLYTPTPTHETVSSCMTQGLWVTDGDFVERGEVVGKIQGVRNIFGISISHHAFETWKDLIMYLQTHQTPFSSCKIPMVLYHGTSKSNYSSILNNGLQETHGMLGQGVYLGSFWKACRFACRTQSYEKIEDPLVIRVVVMAKHILNRPGDRCECDACKEDPGLMPFYTDHLSTWKQWNDAVYLPSSKLMSGKYVVKNAEWAVNKENVTVQQAVDIDGLSVDWSAYKPLQRNIHFL